MSCSSITYTDKPDLFEKSYRKDKIHWKRSKYAYEVWDNLKEELDYKVVFAEDTPEVNNIEEIFNELAYKWRKETRAYSTIRDKVMNDAYLDIIGMGKEVVPFILKDLKEKPDHWYVALRHIEKVDPVNEEDRGNIKKIVEAWLNWGKTQGKI